MINKKFHTLFNNLRNDNYNGYNPYDLLASPMVYNNITYNKARLVLTQINKICPINFRNVLRIEKKYAPKAMALTLSALIRKDYNKYKYDIEFIINWLLDNKSNKFKEYSIGFQFPICLSFYYSEKNSPSLIISLFVMYGLIDYYKLSGDKRVYEAIISFQHLISTNLPQKETKDTLYFSYNFEKFDEVYNATAKVGKYYALLYSITKDESHLIKIDKILNYLYLNQREDGSWPYACDIEYTDSFHTAFILEAIIIMREQVDNPKYKKMVDIGLLNYKNYFIKDSGQMLYIHPDYPNKGLRRLTEVTQTDIRDCAMAIILCNKLKMTDYSKRILDWTFDKMYSRKNNYFYFYKEKYWTNKIEFIRPQAWMLYAISTFNSTENI